MAGYNAAPFARLIEQFERLPGIGAKTAQRLAYHVLKMPEREAQEFADAILNAHKKSTTARSAATLPMEICARFAKTKKGSLNSLRG